MQTNDKQHRAILQKIAHRAMLQRGLLPDFSAKALAKLGRTVTSPVEDVVKEIRSLLPGKK